MIAYKMKEDYTNYPVTGRVYESVYDLLDSHQNLMKEPAVIFLINWPYGFGSALTVQLQNEAFLNSINKNLIVLPHYSNNTRNFKYHDETDNNSFFKYFKYNASVDMNNNIYFAKSVVLSEIPLITYKKLTDPMNKKLIQQFLTKYTPILNENVRTYMDSLKQEKRLLIGIHIRSIAQKHMEDTPYLDIELDKRLHDLKEKIENKHPNAILFIATDVSLYISKMKTLFGKIHYLDYIKRIYNEGDSMPQLDKYKGYTLGRDIMDDCHAMSLCDKIYISNSNIPFIITMMNSSVEMEEY